MSSVLDRFDAGRPEAAGELAVRPMRLADVARVQDIERASFSMPWSRNTFTTLLSRDDAEAWVAVLGGEVAGYAVFWWVVEQGELGDIAVVPDLRGAGIGTRLLEQVFERARLRGVRSLFLEVRESNSRARALYRRHGFTAVGQRREYYSDPLEDAVVMSKRLRKDDEG